MALSIAPASAQSDTTKKSDMSFDLGITRGRNVNLWPFYKKYRDADRKEVQVLYPLFSSKKNYTQHTKSFRILPLFISDSSAGGTDKRIFSFYYPTIFHFTKQYSAEGKTRSFHFMELGPGISLLGISRGPNGLMLENNFFFFIWFKRDPVEDKSMLVVFPFYWNFKHKDVSRTVLFPFVYRMKTKDKTKTNIAFLFNRTRWGKGKDAEKKTVLFPFYWSYRNSNYSKTVLFPLVWNKRDCIGGDTSRKTVVFPFVFRNKNKHSRSLTVFPLFSYKNDLDDGKKRLGVAPLFYRTRTASGTRNVLFPLVWNSKRYEFGDTVRTTVVVPFLFTLRQRNEKDDIIFPFIYRFKTRGKNSLTFFPVFSYTHKADSSLTRLALTPFFWHTETRQETRNVIFPLVWNSKEYLKNDTITRVRIFPFYWASRSKFENNDVLFPFVYRFSDPSRRSITLFPLFHYTHFYDSSLTRLALTPLFWHTETKQGTRNVIFPLVWNNKEFLKDDTVTTVRLLPFYWGVRSRHERSDLLFPLVYSKKDEEKQSFTAIPLFHYTHYYDSSLTRVGVTPFFWHTETKQGTRNVIFPLVWNTKEYLKDDTVTTVRLLPFYWGVRSRKESSDLLFPLVYARKDQYKQTFTALPLFHYTHYYDSSLTRVGLTPFFWHTQTPTLARNVLFPLLWDKKQFFKDDTVRTIRVFPFYWSTRSRKENSDLLLPIVYRKKDRDHETFNVFPLFSYTHRFDSSLTRTGITPFFWRTQTPQRVSNVLFPVLWNKTIYSKDDTLSKTVLFPLYWAVKDKEKNNKIILPFIFSLNDKYKASFTFFPLFSYGKARDSSGSHLAIAPVYWRSKTPANDYTVIFPFWWKHRENFATDTITHKTFFPLYWSRESAKEQNRVVFPLVYSLHNAHRSTFAVLPLFYHYNSKDSLLKRNAITPLFWKTQTRHYEKDLVFPLWWHQKQYLAKDTIERSTLFPVVWLTHGKNFDRKTILPVYISFRDSAKRSITLFPLFSYTHFIDPASTYVAATPLFWHTHTQQETRNILFPIVWSRKEFLKNDTISHIAVLPLYWAVRGKDRRSDLFFPLFHDYSDAHIRSITFVPFFHYSHYLDSDLTRLAVTPLFWHTDAKNETRNVLFPVVWQRKEFLKDDTVNHLSVFPLYWAERSRNEKTDLLLPFLYDHRDRYKKTITAIPLFHYTHYFDSSLTRVAITPFFWHTETKQGMRNVIFPLVWNSKKYFQNDTVNTIRLLPFYRGVRSKNESSDLLFPLVYAKRDQYKQTFTAFPLFHYTHYYDSSLTRVVVTPFFWHAETKTGTHNVIFPFVWNNKEYLKDDTVNTVRILPVYWGVRSRKVNSDLLFPLLYSRKDEDKKTFTALPLFHYTRYYDSSLTRVAITPFLWHTQTKQGQKNVLFPLVWNDREFQKNDTIAHTRILPVYFGMRSNKERSDILFPLLFAHRDSTQRSLTVAPFFSSTHVRKRGYSFDRLVLSPLYWHTRSGNDIHNTFFPIVWNHKNILGNDTINKTFVAPLFWMDHSGHDRNEVLFPLAYHFKNEDRHSFTLFPFVSFGSNKSFHRKYFLLTPLIGYFHTENIAHAWTLPFFFYSSKDSTKDWSVLFFLLRRTEKPGYKRTSFLWPICERLKSDDRRSFRFAPFIWWNKTDSSNMNSIQPFYYSYKSKTKNIFMLSWWLFRRENVKGESVTDNVLWRLYYRKHWSNGDRETRFLHLVYANIKVGGKTEKSILPFYHMSRDSAGNFSRSYFFGFFTHFRQYKPEIKDYYEEEEFFWFVRLKSNYKKLKSEGKTGFTRKRK